MNRIQAVFWAPSYRRFSSSDIGRECESEAAAFADLYGRIVADSNPVSYLNNIYDNAVVELQPDFMEGTIVRDHYELCMVYAKEGATEQEGAKGLTLYPQGQPRNPVGMMYVKKPIEGSPPHFEEYLADLQRG